MVKQKLILLVILLMWIIASCYKKDGQGIGQTGSTTFGDRFPVSNGLRGTIFLLPVTTTKLPDFDTLQPLPNAIYLKQVDIPLQNWSAGFPGLRNRFEWFGLEYKGLFKPIKAGDYLFKLVSDDGSRLYIDDSLFINNDGLHACYPVKGNIYLSGSLHSVKLRYFQGPRYQLGLQLFFSPGGADSLKIFPGNQFLLQATTPGFRWWRWILVAFAAVTVLGAIVYKKRKMAKSS